MKLVFLLITLIALASAAPLLHCNSPTVVKGHYIVTFNQSLSIKEADDHIQEHGLNSIIKHRYMHALNGFSAELDHLQLAQLLNTYSVESIECDQIVSISDCSPPSDAGSWGQTRVAQADMKLNGKYSYPTKGSNVNAYIIDTGIYVDNVDFTGRAEFAFKAESSWSKTDANGHGTHVASTIGGATYGVAPYVSKLFAVKVLGDNGSGTNSGVIAGVNYVASQANSGTKSVANLSLGGGYSSALNNAINNLAAKMVTIVAAGNDNADACNYSPASASEAVTVCSTAEGSSQTDIRSYFSNYGDCVDICAPGSMIKAAWIGSKTAVNTISGTSMAAPHVAGVAALIISNNDKSATPQHVVEELLGTATPNKISMGCSGNCGRTPNLMLFNGCLDV